MTLRPTIDEIDAAINTAGSIRKAAPTLGVDERTVRRWLAAGREDEDLVMGRMNILAIDIETAPNLAYVWDIWNQNIGLHALLESVHMMCFAARWVGSGDETVFFSEFHDGTAVMLDAAWELMDEADVIVHYNGRKFDVPHLNREFVTAGLNPPSPYKQIDLLHQVKRRFKFPSNKLAYVAPALGLEDKESHEGFGLWTSCIAGDADAWGRMRDYNIQDVDLLEQLYYKLRPWIVGHPSYGALMGEDVCPSCGSDQLISSGVAVLATGQYPRYRCGVCGVFSRDTKRTASTGIREVV